VAAEVQASAPFRLSVAGGGSDLPALVPFGRAELLAVALHERLTVQVALRRDGHLRSVLGEFAPWSEPIPVSQAEGLIGAIVRTVAPSGADVRVRAPVTPGAGLGGSGALGVALIGAILHLQGKQLHNNELVARTVFIEREVFRAEVGVQDPAVAAFGGMLRISIDREGAADFKKEKELADCFSRFIAPNLILVDTGKRRAAKDVLAAVKAKHDLQAQAQRLRAQTDRIEAIIRAGDILAYGKELAAHWLAKRGSGTGMTTSEIDTLYELGMSQGCFGGKLVGAGGGGYLLFAGNEQALSSLILLARAKGLIYRRVEVEDVGLRLEVIRP
jgi:D-glycero-alpha-D-manno-heptose-7-phosphate kinase